MGEMRPRVAKLFLAGLFLGLLIAGAPGIAFAFDERDGLCADLVELHRVLRGPRSGVGETHCFTAPIPSPGILTLDVSVPGSAAAEPRLDFLGRSCGGPQGGWGYLERLPAHVMVMVRVPGEYSFCVAAQDPTLALEPYKICPGFLDLSPGWGTFAAAGEEEDPEDPEEDEIDPNLSLLPPPWAEKSGPSLPGRHRLCRGEDDHGETAICATPLALGRTAAGEIGNGWGDDEDFFTFLLPTARTVRIETRGETDTFGGLYDRFGHRLARDDDGGREGNFRIVKTLGPGRYFVRVEGGRGAEGRYRLHLEASD